MPQAQAKKDVEMKSSDPVPAAPPQTNMSKKRTLLEMQKRPEIINKHRKLNVPNSRVIRQ